MPKLGKNAEILLRTLKRVPLVPVVAVVCAAAFGLFAAVQNGSSGAFVMWFFGAATAAPYFAAQFRGVQSSNRFRRLAGFSVVAASVVLSVFGRCDAALFLLFLSPVVYFGNAVAVSTAAVPVAVWTLALRNADYLKFFISFPLRIAAAWLSASALSVCGFDAVSDGTSIFVDGREIAITAACSGVEQLEAMLLVGWLFAAYMHANTAVRLVHFLTILPIIIFTNSLRLFITIAGVETFGDVFLSDSVHTAFGLAMVVATVGLFILAGLFFPDGKAKK